MYLGYTKRIIELIKVCKNELSALDIAHIHKYESTSCYHVILQVWSSFCNYWGVYGECSVPSDSNGEEKEVLDVEQGGGAYDNSNEQQSLLPRSMYPLGISNTSITEPLAISTHSQHMCYKYIEYHSTCDSDNSTNTNWIIDIQHVNIYTGQYPTCILPNFSLRVPPHTHILITGASGVGKSTLMKFLGGLLTYGDNSDYYTCISDNTLASSNAPVSTISSDTNNTVSYANIYCDYKYVLVLPQHSYCLYNTMRENLLYGISLPEDRPIPDILLCKFIYIVLRWMDITHVCSDLEIIDDFFKWDVTNNTSTATTTSTNTTTHDQTVKSSMEVIYHTNITNTHSDSLIILYTWMDILLQHNEWDEQLLLLQSKAFDLSKLLSTGECQKLAVCRLLARYILTKYMCTYNQRTGEWDEHGSVHTWMNVPMSEVSSTLNYIPSVLLLDEITSGVDIYIESRIYTTLFELFHTTSTIISIGHHTSLIPYHTVELRIS